jgi:hypothetical protein
MKTVTKITGEVINGIPTETETYTYQDGMSDPITSKMMVAQLGVNGEAPGDV